MGRIVPFTDNYRDLSNENGFQFEFVCERCGNGHRSPFYPNALGIGASVVRTAGRFFGGALGRAAYSTYDLDRLTNSAGKDKALAKAVETVAPAFRQCHGCGNWHCVEVCWNDETGQCVNCTPKLHQTITTAQGQAQVRQVREQVEQQDWIGDLDLTRQAPASCPSCHAPTGGGKFCGSCGTNLMATRYCSECGTQVPTGSGFCSQCGTPA